MKKSVLLIAVLCLISFCFIGFTPAKAEVEDNSPSRVINLVFDDSSSMIINAHNEMVDTWCQAKYSMEVFAAMLGKKDVMNVYIMYDFCYDTNSGPALTLLGSDGAQTNVSKIHNLPTNAGGTPFSPVKKAYADLVKASADEKWLVVLTDGQFYDADENSVNDFFDRKASTVKVLFLSMGKDAAAINSNSQKEIFSEKAETNNQILNKLTTICTRIFNSNRLDVDVSSGKFEFDVPMSELIVFAQGANVSINGVVDGNGKLIKSSNPPVSVKYSEVFSRSVKKDYVDKGKIIVAKDLMGCVLTFNDNFDPGEYKVDIDGAETIEVYYKPNLEIAAYVTDSEGNEVSDMENLQSGEYTLNFGFVKPGTREPIAESKLLGDISYEATVINNGEYHEKAYKNGDKVLIEEGSFSASIVARYLEYNTITKNIGYNIYSDKEISFDFLECNDVIIAGEFPDPNECRTIIKATVEGRDFSTSQWSQMGLPLVTANEISSRRIGVPLIEKTAEPGVYTITPSFTKSKPRNRNYDLTQDYTISFEEKVGPAVWSGSANGSLNFVDTRSFFEQNLELIIFLIILAVILYLLIGYIPGVKKYLPKSLKKHPSISDTIGSRNEQVEGQMTKGRLWYLPYFPQTATIRFLPQSVYASPSTIDIEALKGRRFRIKNISNFAGKTKFKLDGSTIPKNLSKAELNDLARRNAFLTIDYYGDRRHCRCQISKAYQKRKRRR